MKSLLSILGKIQAELKAPKNQFNNFGGYNYRSAEDILEAVKPLLTKHKAVLLIDDEVLNVGAKNYIKASATIICIETGSQLTATGLAAEEVSKKGMDAAQLTGSTSSYARKYALNGLFSIDDAKDADATNKHEKGDSKQPSNTNAGTTSDDDKKWLNKTKKDSDELTPEWVNVLQGIDKGKITSIQDVRKVYKVNKKFADELESLIKLK